MLKCIEVNVPNAGEILPTSSLLAVKPLNFDLKTIRSKQDSNVDQKLRKFWPQQEELCIIDIR